MSHEYKKVAPSQKPPINAYNPAQAVRDMGDSWRWSSHIRLRDSSTLGSSRQDDREAAIMRMCERGEISRTTL